MMDDRARHQIELALWPSGESTPGSLWAILDCARDRRIYSELAVSRLDYQCLYSGDLPNPLKAVAPHMVELSPRYGFTKTLLDQSWGRSWGIFVRINDSTRLRQHLRKFLTVRSEEGRRLLFRYFDPRVLRTYLPTCTPQELELLFGPVTTYFAEGDAPHDHLHAYGLDGGKLLQRSTSVELSAREDRRP